MLSFAWLAVGIGLAEALLIPMPDAKDVERTPPIEHVSFHLSLTCPDSGDILRFYRPRLETQGYRLCDPGEVHWKSSPTVTGEELSYRSIFVNDATGKAILVDASCSLTNGRTTATQQTVNLTLLHDQATPDVERAFKVSCGAAAAE